MTDEVSNRITPAVQPTVPRAKVACGLLLILLVLLVVLVKSSVLQQDRDGARSVIGKTLQQHRDILWLEKETHLLELEVGM
ncbi:unnamed protein product [Merluccius merluccius]